MKVVLLSVLWMINLSAGLAQTSIVLGPGTVSSGTSAQAIAPAPDAEVEKLRKQLADWPQLARYRDANHALPPLTPGRVIFYGDSITDGWAKPTNAAIFFPGKPYVGRGVSGQTTPQMLIRFRQDVIDLHPEAVAILAGINDIAGNTGPITPQQTEDNLTSMAELAKAHGIRVLLCSILPAGDIRWRPGTEPAPKVIAINTWMKEYAAKEGFTYVDYWTPMATSAGAMKDGLSVDGVHPTTAGYQVMARIAEVAIEAK